MKQPTNQLYIRLVFAEALAHDDPRIGECFPIGGTAPDTLVIGRTPDTGEAALVIDFDIWSSRVNSRLAHFQVGDQQGLVVSDLHSRNGTWVDGSRISQRTPVSAGQVLRMGSSVFVVGEKRRGQDGHWLTPPQPLPQAIPAFAHSTLVMLSHLAECSLDNQTLFLSGESGTDGETFATWWHQSRRGNEPFVLIDGSQRATATRLEAQLFGDGGEPGHLAKAQNGSLCIQNFHALPRDVARKLIEGSEVSDLYPAQTIALWKTDVGGTPYGLDTVSPERVVYARVPPLRERREEILALFVAALGEARSIISGRPCLPNVELAEAMVTGAWTFNVEGLWNLAGRFVDGEALTPDEVHMHSKLGGESARAIRAPDELAARIRRSQTALGPLADGEETLDRSR